MNTGLGGWMPISRHLKKSLPIDRPYTELEAMYSLQLDYHDGNEASEAGYASLWRWSRTRVRNFLSNVSAEISEAKNQRSLGKVLSSLNKTGTDTGRGQAPIQAEDRQRTGRGQARLINISKLDDDKDRQRTGTDTGRGQAAIQAEDRQQDTTIESRKERVETDITTTPLPPAGGGELSEEGKGGDGQPSDPPLPTVADLPGQSEQTGKGKRAKKPSATLSEEEKNALRPVWWPPDLWEHFKKHRMAIKPKDTEYAYKLLIKEFELAKEAGESAESILSDMCQGKGWAGYKLEWVKNRRSGPSTKSGIANKGAANGKNSWEPSF